MTLLSGEVGVNEAEALRVPALPLEIVHQTPTNITLEIHFVFVDGLEPLVQILIVIGYAARVVLALVLVVGLRAEPALGGVDLDFALF